MHQFMEMDFKYFICLIGEKELIRLVFILKENPSDLLKNTTEEFLNDLNSKISEDLKNWGGNLDQFDDISFEHVKEIINLTGWVAAMKTINFDKEIDECTKSKK